MSRDVPIRPAATLLIVRDAKGEAAPEVGNSRGGVEVLALRRSAAMRFLPGHLAFPGGTLDREDWESYEHLQGNTFVQNQGMEDDVTYAAGALRECAEEVGIVCAARRGGVITEFSLEHRVQEELLSDGVSYHAWLALQGLAIDFSLLRFVGRWVTPPVMPARFDTRFFLYLLQNTDIETRVSLAENDWAKWVSPHSALAEIETGKIEAVPPTIAMLRALDGYDSVDDCFSELSVPGPAGDKEVIRP